MYKNAKPLDKQCANMDHKRQNMKEIFALQPEFI